MRRGLAVAVALVAVATVAGGAAPAGRRISEAAVAASSVRTYVYAGSRKVGYISLTRGYWYASFLRPAYVAWAYHGGAKTFFSGCEGESDENRNGVALRLTPTRWNVASFPDFHHLGALIWVRPGRWTIVDAHGKPIGHTEGPNGIPAGLIWLRSC